MNRLRSATGYSICAALLVLIGFAVVKAVIN